MRVLIGCDGDGHRGVGHVIRSLALAETAVAAGHDVVVAGSFEGSFLQGQLNAAPVEVVPLPAPVPGDDPRHLIDLVGRLRPDVLHVDSYEPSARLRELVVAAVFSNMEDGTFGRRPADVVVDPTLGAQLSARPDDGSTWLLRGSRYTPVRQRVIDARRGEDVGIGVSKVGNAPGAHRPVAPSVLVVMGGTDPLRLAPAAVRLLAGIGLALEVTVIAVGEIAERVHAAAAGSRLSLNVLAPVDDLPERMSGQSLVVSAAGTTVWELCCIGVPMAVLWAVDNQREGYQRVVAAGAAVGLGGPEVAEPEPGRDGRAVGRLRRVLTDQQVGADLVLAGRNLVDGLAAWRVVQMWEQAGRQPQGLHGLHGLRGLQGGVPSHAPGMVVRLATLEDSRALWEWRNDAGTRAGSRSSDPVPWLEHRTWLEASLTREDRVLLVVEDLLGPVGTVRWDLESQGEWQVSVTVAPQRRGQSLARPLLRAAEMALSEPGASERAPLGGTAVAAYLAVVHRDNAASLRLFETSFYVPDLPPDPRGFLRFRKAARAN